MFRKRKELKRESITETLMRDIQGSPAEKLAMFQKMKAAGGFERRPSRAESGGRHAADVRGHGDG